MEFNNITFPIRKDGDFRLLGRQYFEDDVPVLSWSNSGIEFEASFERIIVTFFEHTHEFACFVKIFIDDKEYKFGIHGKANRAVIEGFKDKKHKVRIIRISERNDFLKIDTVQLFGKKPYMKALPEKKLKLEFIGDSITCGYGVIAEKEADKYDTYQQDSTKTYAYLTAKALCADIRTECISGQGIVHSCGEEVGTVFEEFFGYTTRQGKNYVCDGYIPDVFIINGGTNDKLSHVTPEEFEEAAIRLLTKVRTMYPETPIIWVYGMMMLPFEAQVRSAIKKFAKANKDVYCIITKPVSKMKNEVGAVGHPNHNASVRVSKILVRKIRTILSKKK